MSEEQAKTTNQVGEDDSTVEKEEQNKLEDPAVKDREKKKHYYGSFLIDGSVAVVLFVLAFLDKFRFSKTVPNYSGLPENPYSCIIVLLPAVVAILAVSLSLSKEKIYGVTLRDIKTLRGPFYFDFLHVVIVMAVVIGLGFIFYALDLKITLYSLEIVAFLYALYFAVQDIPVMACQNWLLRIILQRNYQVIHSDNLLQEDRARETFDTMMTNIVLEEGMDTAYKALTKCNRREINPSQILEDLIDYEFRFFRDYQKDFSEKHSALNPECCSESITKKIDHGYKNILHLLSYDSDGILNGLLGSDKFCSITKCIYALHKLCSAIGLEGKEKEQLTGILEKVMPSYFSKPKEPLATSFLVCMLSSTLYKGETWFVRYIRDCEDPLRYLISFSYSPIGVFISMLIYHAKRVLVGERKKEIEEFLKEPEEGINSHGDTWQSAMQFSLEYIQTTNAIQSICDLLLFYRSIPSDYFSPLGNGNGSSGSSDDDFTEFNLFHDWLLLVFASLSNDDFSPETFDATMNRLEERDKKILAEELSENWLLDGKLRSDVDCSFLKFYEGDNATMPSSDWSKEPFVKKLVDIHDKYYEEEYKSKYATNSNDGVEKARQDIIDSFNEGLKKCEFYDPVLNVDNASKLCFRFWLRGENWKDILEAHLKQIPLSLEMKTREKIESASSAFAVSKGEKPDVIIDKIKVIGATHTSSRYWGRSYLANKDSEIKEKMAALGLKYIPGIPLQLFWKEGAIKFNAKIDETQPLIRPLTSSEIEEVIQQEYTTFENGLYRYSATLDDGRHSFYVTKEELVEKLKNTYFYVCIVFQYDVSCDSNGVLIVDKKYDWGDDSKNSGSKTE